MISVLRPILLAVVLLILSSSVFAQPLVDSLSENNYYTHDGHELAVWVPAFSRPYGRLALVKFGPFENYDCQSIRLDEIRKRERVGLNTKLINQTTIFSESMNISAGKAVALVTVITEHVDRHTANTTFGFLAGAEDENEEDEEGDYWTMIKWDATIPVDSTKWTFVSEHKDKLTKFGKTAHLGYIQSALASYDVETIHLMKQPSRKNAFGLLYISISRDGRGIGFV